jgi:hypothetical protein
MVNLVYSDFFLTAKWQRIRKVREVFKGRKALRFFEFQV